MDGFDYTPALSASRALTAGAFNPHLYAIGSSVNPSFFEDEHLLEKVKEEVRSGNFDLLQQALTLHHELVHMVQFLSTTFGSRCVLRLNAALESMRNQNGHLSLPIAQAQTHGSNKQRDPATCFQDLVQFYYGEFQSLSGTGSGLQQWPRHHDSMALQRFSDQTEESANENFKDLLPHAPEWLTLGAKNRSIAFERVGRRFNYVDLNAAKLFEAFAVLSEFNLILWLDDELEDLNWADRYLTGLSIEYRCIIRLYVDLFGHEDRFLTPNLAALIDIALMYDPEQPDLPENDRLKQYNAGSPINLFWHVCRVSQQVRRVSSDDPEDAQRFQDEVCAAAGLPPMGTMIDRALLRLKAASDALAPGGSADALRVGDKAIGVDDLSIPLALHHNMLSLRQRLPEAFFWRILDPEFTQQFFLTHHSSLTFYNMETRSRWDRKPWLWASASLGGVALDAGMLKHLDCPLKQGRPYFCDAEGDPFGVFCVREQDAGATLICPFAKFHTSTDIGVDLSSQRAFNPD